MKHNSRRKTRVRLAAALAAVTALATLTACGGSGKGSHSESAKSVTLTVWDVQYFPDQTGSAGDIGRALKQIDEMFMKEHPNVKVEHVGYAGDQFFTKLRSAIAAKSGADVVTMGGGSFPVSSGYYKGLRPLYDLITPQQKKELNPILDQEAIGDEAHYAIPYQAGVYLFYYNKKLFSQAGIQNPPTTYDELLSDCTSLKKAGITPIGAGFTGNSNNLYVNYGLGSQLLGPSDLLDWSNHKIGWTDPKMVQSLNDLQKMATTGCFGDAKAAGTRTAADGATQFEGGKAAMVFSNVRDSTSLGQSLGGIDNLGVFPFPDVPGSKYPSGTPDSGYNANWSITNFSQSCGVAWQYISFLESVPAQNVLFQVGHTLPNNSSVTATGANAVDDAVLKLATNPNGHRGPGATESAQEQTLDQRLYSQLVSGALSPSGFASQMQAVRDQLPAAPADGALPKPPPCN